MLLLPNISLDGGHHPVDIVVIQSAQRSEQHGIDSLILLRK